MTGFVERSWTTPDGLRLSGRDYPGAAGSTRLPVICLHGLTRNARDFEEVAPMIAGLGRQVIALDMRGRGASAHDPDPAHYAVPVYVGDVIGWAVALGIRRAVILGTSMGGLMTMALAAAAPELVAAAVLNDAGPEIAPAGLARIFAYVGGGETATDWSSAAAYARKTNGAAFPTYGEGEWLRFARRLFTEREGRIMLDYDPAIAAALSAPMPQVAPDLWPLFATLAQGRPLLLIRGKLSDVLAQDACDKMRARAGHMQVCEIDQVGHAPSLGEPEAIAALTRFLSVVD